MKKFKPFSYLYHNASSAGKDKIPFYCRSVGQRMGDENYRSNLTSHYFCEFIWTIDGHGTIELNKEKHEIPPSSVFILPPDVRRVLYTDRDFWHFRWFTVTGDFFIRLVDSFNLPFLKAGYIGYPLSSDFIQLETDIKESLTSGVNNASTTVFNILNKSASPESTYEKKSPLTKQALELIEKNIGQTELNVDWISESLGCSRSHLSRVFKKENGLSPSEYISRRRLQTAMDALKNSSNKVSKIADACGFTDADYFSRYFKKQTGATPAKFRKDESP